MAARYFEDLKPGDTFKSGSVDVTQDSIIAYAREFDPQPFHTDPTAAMDTLFGGLVASGWHTASMTMRLFTASDLRIVNGIIGGGVEQLTWPRPVRPGDRLSLRGEIMETRPSRSKPDRGMIRVKVETVNQKGEVVQSFIGQIVVLRRNGGA